MEFWLDARSRVFSMDRLELAQQVAQVAEVLLAGAPLGKGHALPLGDELLRGHGRVSGNSQRG